MKAAYCTLLLCLLQLTSAFSRQPCNGIFCDRGKCVDNACQCDPCYSGPDCSAKSNTKPEVKDVEITGSAANAASGQAVGTVTAADPDSAVCTDCDCGRVRYSLLDDSNGRFSVNELSGKLVAKADLVTGRQYSLRLRAANTGPFAEDASVATVTINVADDIVQSRRRRSTVNAPSSVEFQYTQVYPAENKTHLQMGERLGFEVTVSFPHGTTDMNVEMFSPDNETAAVIMICDAQIKHVGSNLNVNTGAVMANATYEGKPGSKWPYVRIVLRLGDVVNSAATAASASEFQVVIAYEAVFLYNTIATQDTEYWVSAGVEYNNESIIWIGQTSFKADMSDSSNLTNPLESPTMNITGDSDIYPGRVSLYQMDISIPYLYTNFTLDVFGPLNNSELLTICGTYVKSAGTGLGCTPLTEWPYDFTLTKQKPTYANYYRSSLSFTATKYTNKAYRTPNSTTSDHLLSITFALSTNSSAAAGTTSYIGATADFGAEVVTGYKTVTVSSSTAPASTNVSTSDPTIQVTRIGPQTLSPGMATMFELTMDTAPGTIYDYQIQALAPVNNSLGRMKICRLNVTYAGRNIPCIGKLKEHLTTTYQTLYGNGTVPSDQYDYAYISLPGLANIGNVPTSVDPLANRITVRMVIVANNHSLNVPDEDGYVTMGVMYADKQWVSISTVNFTSALNMSNLPNSSLPQVSMAYVIGDSNFNVGETAVIDATTTFARGAVYEPLDFEFIAPFQNDSAVMSICSFQIIHVGSNIGCWDKTKLQRSIQFVSKSNDTVNTKAVFSLGATTNVGDPSGSVDEDDTIKIRFHVKMMEHEAHSNGSVYQISYGFQFSTDQIWIAQLNAMLMQPAVDLPALTGDFLPHTAFQTDTNPAYAGDVVTRQLLLKVAPGSQSQYRLHVTVPSFASLCTISVVSVGRNLSCVNGTAIKESATRTFFTTAGKEKLTANASFDLGYLHNAAENVTLDRSSLIDDNTLALRIFMQIDGGASTGSADIQADIYHLGTAAPVQVTHSLTVAAGVRNFSVGNETPTFNLGLAPLFEGLNETTVYAPGQGFKAVLTIKTIPNSQGSMRVQFVTPVNAENQMDIVHVVVTKVGLNTPCVVPYGQQGTITRRNNSLSSDYGTLDLGNVCNVGFSSDTADDEIVIEAIGRVWTSDATFTNGSLPLHCLAFRSEQQIFVHVMNISVDKNAVPPQFFPNTSNLAVSFNDTSPLWVNVGSDFIITMVVEVPEKVSSLFRVDVRNAEANTSAWATVNEVNITSSGINLIGLSNEPYSLQLNSSFGTYQKDVGSLQVFTLQNAGITSSTSMASPPADSNNFTISFNLKMADPIHAENGTKFQISAGMQLLDRIVIGLRDVYVVRTGTESPDSEVLVNVTVDSASPYSAGSPVLIKANITVSNTSTAELQNPILFLHTPSYIEFVDFANITYESGGITYSALPNAGMKFEFNNTIFFKESVVFYFNVALKSGLTLPGNRPTANATSVYEMTYNMHDRTGNPNSGKWFRQAGSLSFMVTSTVIPSISCFDDLGMSDPATIKDCQISTFMSPFTGFDSAQVRPTGSGWKPHIRGKDYKNLRYVTILFGTLKQVSRVVIHSTGGNKTTCINVYKTKDGRAFSIHDKQVSIGALYSGSTANVTLSKIMVTRGIRIGICGTTGGDDAEVEVKVGLIGCSYSGPDFYQFDPCTRKSYEPGSCGRHYLATPDNSTIFYCDYVLTNTEELTGTSKCYKASTSNPRVWQYLGPSVGRVIAYQPSTSRVFGLAQGCAGSGDTDRSYLMSEDDGNTWAVTNPQSYIDMRDSPLSGTVVQSKDIEWKLGSNFEPGINGTACDLYAAGDWRLCYDGIYHTNDQVVSWNSCCLR